MCARESSDFAITRDMAFREHVGDGVPWIRRVIVESTGVPSFKQSPPFQHGQSWLMQGLRYVVRLPYIAVNDNDWTTEPVPYDYVNTHVTSPGRLALPRFIHGDSHAGPIRLGSVTFTPTQAAPGQWRYELHNWYRIYNPGVTINQFDFGGTYGPPDRNDLDKWAITHYRILARRKQENGSFVEEDLTGIQSCYIAHRLVMRSPQFGWSGGVSPEFMPDAPINHVFNTPITMDSDDELLVDYWYTQKLLYPWAHPALLGPPFVQPTEQESPFIPGLMLPVWGLRSLGTPFFPRASVSIAASNANYRVPRVMKYRLRFPENHSWRPGNSEYVDLAKSGSERRSVAQWRPTPLFPYPAVWAVPSPANIDDPITTIGDGDGIACEQHGNIAQTQKWRFAPKTERGRINKVTVHALMKCGPTADACPMPACRVQLSFNPVYPSSGPLQFSVPLTSAIPLTTVYQWFTYELAVPGIGFGESDSSAAVSLTSQGYASDSVLYLDALYLDAEYGTSWSVTNGPTSIDMAYTGETHSISFGWGREYPEFLLKRGTSQAIYRVANPLGYTEEYVATGGESQIRVLDPGQWDTSGTSVWQLYQPTSQSLATWPNQFELERYQ
jgi:hypothetical protein